MIREALGAARSRTEKLRSCDQRSQVPGHVSGFLTVSPAGTLIVTGSPSLGAFDLL